MLKAYSDNGCSPACLFPQVAFVPDMGSFAEDMHDPMFVLNRVVDVCFMLDLLFNFIRPVGALSRHVQSISRHYLKTFFIVDLVSAFPFDVIAMYNTHHG